MTQLGAPFQICTYRVLILFFSTTSCGRTIIYVTSLLLMVMRTVSILLLFQTVPRWIILFSFKVWLIWTSARQGWCPERPVQCTAHKCPLCAQRADTHDSLAPRSVTHPQTPVGKTSFLGHQGCTTEGHNLRRSPESGKSNPFLLREWLQGIP